MAKLEQVLDGVWRWRWFSEEKGLDFNGWAVKLPAGLILIDPVYAEETTWKAIEALGKPAKILLTNKDHERASDELRRRFKAPVAVHEDEAPLLTVPPEETFKDGQKLLKAFDVVRFKHLKSPGECAFLWRERRALFAGDVVTGTPPGSIGIVKKHVGRQEVLEDVQSLVRLDFDALLVGDGEPILKDAKSALDSFLLMAHQTVAN